MKRLTDCLIDGLTDCRCVRTMMAGLLAVLMSGCMSAPFQSPGGLLTVSRAPLSTDGNWRAGAKSGEASVQSVLGLCAWGDCSITAAAQNGGLKHVDYLDYKYVNVIGIWQQVTVTAYGE